MRQQLSSGPVAVSLHIQSQRLASGVVTNQKVLFRGRHLEGAHWHTVIQPHQVRWTVTPDARAPELPGAWNGQRQHTLPGQQSQEYVFLAQQSKEYGFPRAERNTGLSSFCSRRMCVSPEYPAFYSFKGCPLQDHTSRARSPLFPQLARQNSGTTRKCWCMPMRHSKTVKPLSLTPSQCTVSIHRRSVSAPKSPSCAAVLATGPDGHHRLW